jgi:hypothetical protein
MLTNNMDKRYKKKRGRDNKYASKYKDMKAKV